MNYIKELKIRLREDTSPFFNDKELEYYYNLYNNDLNVTTYNLLLIKAEDDSISIPGGLSIPSNQNYWLRLARKYKPNYSRVLV